jgi:fermentation-respiration switch protein FrsA (DUF1100 family)
MTHALIWLAAALVGLSLFVRWLEPRMTFFPFAGEDVTPRTFGIAFEPLTIHTTDGERLRAWRMDVPAPRARVLYFHGNGGNLSNWAPILAAIVKRGYSVAAIDYRGYGLSTGRPTERGLYHDADAFVRAVWTDGDARVPTIVWGRSLGAAVAAYAATVRKPDGLIIESGFPDARSIVRGSPVLAVLSLFATYRFPTAELANRARVPVLQMHGDRDSVIPFALGQELSGRLDGDKQFVVIAGGDHNDDAPRDPAAYWGAIERFVERLTRPTTADERPHRSSGDQEIKR